LTPFFDIPKGKDDIRMVYDGLVSGLSDAMRVLRFVLPTLETHLRLVEAGTYFADIDVGEMFLNFMLHEPVRIFAGVDFAAYLPLAHGGVVWERWQ
jgi:hypothetical protein